MTKGNKPNTAEKNIWVCRMIRDVLLASLNKGQFPVACIFFIIIYVLYKIPAEDVSQFVKDVIKSFENGYITGWVISVALALGWYFNARHLRKMHTKEMTRVANEKSYLQNKAAGKKLQSSNKKNFKK